MHFLATYLVFRFITGLCGAAFLSVAGGSVSDLFDNQHVARCVVSRSPTFNGYLIRTFQPYGRVLYFAVHWSYPGPLDGGVGCDKLYSLIGVR